ncbi:ribonuclease P 40kDa subunit-domain-containing protein [Trametes elegans]|nr:ribonuclease P 40kDa subunit-domain-containing protein [Trametes elegans]
MTLFCFQIDVVFESGQQPLEDALLKLQSCYWTCESTLDSFLDFVKSHVNHSSLESKITALGLAGPASEDVWSLDSRGFLTLVVGKETYESLGLVGKALPWRERKELHVIRISIRASRPSTDCMRAWHAFGTKEAHAIRRWDSRRQPWKVFYHCEGTDDSVLAGSVRHELSRRVRNSGNLYIPDPSREAIVSRKHPSGDDNGEWEDAVAALFEWVAMASLASPRLSVNDHCDPYIAVYTPPEPSHGGNITTMRWNGFIPASFVRTVLQTITSPNAPAAGFVAVTAQCIGSSPVSYLPTESSKVPPVRVPRRDAEDTWSLVYAKDPADGGSWWALAESVGQWDQRWG